MIWVAAAQHPHTEIRARKGKNSIFSCMYSPFVDAPMIIKSEGNSVSMRAHLCSTMSLFSTRTEERTEMRKSPKSTVVYASE